MIHQILHWLGIDDVSGRPYAFWSGFGSDIGELGIIAGLLAMVRRHNCHEPHCWRIGRFPVEGTVWLTCRRHHPAPPEPGDIGRG